MSRLLIPSRWEAAFWSLQSHTWDDYLQFPECREEIQTTVAWLAERQPAAARVLDVGCGTGNYAVALAERGCEVVGIDFSAGMLRRARAKAARTQAGQARFEQINIDAPLPFPTAVFDGAIAVAVLQCVADPLLLLCEVYRVLRPGGYLLLVALDPLRHSTVKGKLPTTPLRWLARQIKALGNRSRRVRRYTRADLEHLLAEAGFVLQESRLGQGTLGLLSKAAPQS